MARTRSHSPSGLGSLAKAVQIEMVAHCLVLTGSVRCDRTVLRWDVQSMVDAGRLRAEIARLQQAHAHAVSPFGRDVSTFRCVVASRRLE